MPIEVGVFTAKHVPDGKTHALAHLVGGGLSALKRIDYLYQKVDLVVDACGFKINIAPGLPPSVTHTMQDHRGKPMFATIGWATTKAQDNRAFSERPNMLSRPLHDNFLHLQGRVVDDCTLIGNIITGHQHDCSPLCALCQCLGLDADLGWSVPTRVMRRVMGHAANPTYWPAFRVWLEHYLGAAAVRREALGLMSRTHEVDH